MWVDHMGRTLLSVAFALDFDFAFAFDFDFALDLNSDF
jgi:hypothetical protein